MNIKTQAYEQNYQQFRSLNQIMWQIPVLAMTLTGGLWFGVSNLQDNPLLVTVLLLTAMVGNLTLVAILYRFRHVMGCYIDWLRQIDTESFVEASKPDPNHTSFEKFCNTDKIVRSLFSFLLYWAAGLSFVVLLGYWAERLGVYEMRKNNVAVSFYDRQALDLADSYESVDFEKAYPFILPYLDSGSLDILDIGSGTGRDAAWLSTNGHVVTAVDPSSTMRSLAATLHPDTSINWLDARLPSLENTELSPDGYDLVLVNAVWMHVAPQDQRESMERIFDLTKDGGRSFVSLRLGPQSSDRGMYAISSIDFVELARSIGFSVTPVGDYPDLLGRADVSWKIFELMR